ncbi:MAG TPA: hypothetical protein ENJ37_03860 [Deltaproteobacteria bacterium]|nr:hypothetical protein [Deltaproteobacteria bacterium]
MTQVDEPKTAHRGGGPEEGGASREHGRVEFSPEQQHKVQELIDEAYRRAFAKARSAKTTSEEVAEMKKEIERLRREKRRAAVMSAVSRRDVVDADEVASLIAPHVSEGPGGELYVEDGKSGGVPLGEYVDRWLSERPHHLRARGAAGAGSGGARFAEARRRYDLSDHTVWRNMPREDFERFMAEGVSVQGASGRSYTFKDVKNPFVQARRMRRQQQGG